MNNLYLKYNAPRFLAKGNPLSWRVRAVKSYYKILSLLALFALSVATLVGCGPTSPSKSEFSGEIVTEVPKVPGVNKRYPMPEIDKDTNGAEPAADTEETTK